MINIDFHAHILPKADHGSDSEETSAIQLSLLKNAGVGTVVATPHFYPNRHNIMDFEEKTNRAVDMLSGISLDNRPQIAVGAEVLICENIDKLEHLSDLCIRGTNVMLLEMPMADEWSNSLFKTVSGIVNAGYTVVLAHIDRYLPEHSDDIRFLLDNGAYAQINARAFKKPFMKRRLAAFLKSDRLVAFGSDIHGIDKSASKAFSNLKKLDSDLLETVTKRSNELLKNAIIY